MSTFLEPVRRTRPLKHLLIARLISGIPLARISMLRLVGVSPLRPRLEAARVPMSGVGAVVVPILGVLAGLMLLSGAFARIGELIAYGSMGVAIYVHLNADWYHEPPIILPIAVLAASLYVLWRGGGAWTVYGRTSK